jgi:hypothetical protein
MPDDVPSVSQIVRQLPPSFRGTFNSLGQYVQGVIREIRGNDAPPLSAKRLRFIQLMVFIYLLNRYLEEGTKAAERAVEISNELGFESFSIGRTVFSKDNENTMLGRRLAKELLSSVNEPALIEIFQQSNSVRSLVRNLLFKTRLING